MAIEGAEGFGIAGRGATLVLRTSWFNRSSWILAKEITAIRVSVMLRSFFCCRVSGMRIFGEEVAGWMDACGEAACALGREGNAHEKTTGGQGRPLAGVTLTTILPIGTPPTGATTYG
ncbi:hypothetical protein BHM03_00037338 [Ensete ventricosum]|nr:hypothetical protein BHM03_00037338 [Ensete ventricosum]